MTSDQILILALLAAAFATGWAARGAGSKLGRSEPRHQQQVRTKRERQESASDPERLVTRITQEVGRALAASHLAVGEWSEQGPRVDASTATALEVLAHELTELAALETEVSCELGEKDPLRLELARIAHSLSLFGSDLSAGSAGLEGPRDRRTSGMRHATRYSWQPTTGRRSALPPTRRYARELSRKRHQRRLTRFP